MLPNSPDGWTLTQEGFDPATFQAWETLFTLGSGYLHVRGSLEEHLSDAPQNVEFTRTPTNVTSERFRPTVSKWGTYVPGIYGRHPLLGHELVNLPWFLWTRVQIDRETLAGNTDDVREQRRSLNLRDATLRRAFVWRSDNGIDVSVTLERFLSAVRPHLCVQRLTMRFKSGAHQMHAAFGIDGDVRTNGHNHVIRVSPSCEEFKQLRFHAYTDDAIEVDIAAEMPWARDSQMWPMSGGEESSGNRLAARGHFYAIPEREYVFERRTAVATNRDSVVRTATHYLEECSADSLEQLHAEHSANWARRWDACDVIVEGDPASQLALRVSLYHLLRSHVEDARVAIDPKGYTSDAYWGRFFWDTEMCLLPFFLYTQPQKARTLVDFRVNTLPGAMENARRYGYAGARYAWESDPDGHECCPNWQYADHEIHVTADVVYGLAHFAAATGDESYLRDPAARVIVETARYWMERIDWRNGEPCLLGVMGPDEYTPISSNNAFTNRLMRFALDLAARIGDSGGATAEERAAFADVAARVPIPRHPEDPRLVLQCEEFPIFAEPDFDRFWKDRTKTFASQVSQERLYRSKCLKQADVLMLMMLFPHEFSDEEVTRAWEYYLPYTTHDSSLSPGVHGVVACRLGRIDDARRFWQQACAIDLDIEAGGAREGIHIANCGLIWQMAVFGFAGVRTALQADVLTLSPRLPNAWTRLAFPLVWKGCRVHIDVRAKGTTIENRAERPLDVCVWDESRTLAPGTSAAWKGD